MPAFGLAAVPLPTKNRRMLPGCHPPRAAALGEPTPDTDETAAAAADGSTGAPVLTAADGFAVRADPLNSRRAAANAAHANGAAAGPSPLPPPPNHANTEPPRPLTRPDAAADITGGAATGVAFTASTTVGPAAPPSAVAGESSTASTELVSTSRAWRGDTSTVSTLSTNPASPAAPATTDSGRPWRAADVEPAPGSLTAELRPSASADESPSDAEATSSETRAPARAGAFVEGSAESAPEPPRPVRTAPRAGWVADDPDDPDASAESDDPVEPPDPVVSANATGTATTADPTPSATANAPTRPT